MFVPDDDGGHLEELYVQTISRGDGEFVVEFSGNEGEYEYLNGLTINEAYEELEKEVPEGYSFGGWKTGEDEYGTEISGAYSDGSDKYSTEISTGDVLYPKWVDETAPTLEVGISTGWDEEMILDISASDSGDGIDGYYVGTEDPNGEDGVLYLSFAGETRAVITGPGRWYVSVCDKAGNFAETSFVVDEVTLESRLVAADTSAEDNEDEETERILSTTTHSMLCEDGSEFSIEQYVTGDIKPISCTDDEGNEITSEMYGSLTSRSDMYILLKFNESKHTYEWVTTKKPTCTEPGIKELTCKYCGHVSKTKEVDPEGHAYTDWEVSLAPTCTEIGEQFHDCELCGEHETEEIDATGHDYTSTYIYATGTCAEAYPVYMKVCKTCRDVTYETGRTMMDCGDRRLLDMHDFSWSRYRYRCETGGDWGINVIHESVDCPYCAKKMYFYNNTEWMYRCPTCHMFKMAYKCETCSRFFWVYWKELEIMYMIQE